MSAKEFYSVPIPAEDLDAVYQLLAERSRMRDADTSAPLRPDVAGRSDLKDEVWTEELLERIAKGDTISTQVLTDIMDVIARDPRGSGHYNRDELAQETSHSPGRLTATFTKLTPHFRKHYGTDAWPIVGESGANFEPAKSGTFYWMSSTISDRWKRIRNL